MLPRAREGVPPPRSGVALVLPPRRKAARLAALHTSVKRHRPSAVRTRPLLAQRAMPSVAKGWSETARHRRSPGSRVPTVARPTTVISNARPERTIASAPAAAASRTAASRSAGLPIGWWWRSLNDGTWWRSNRKTAKPSPSLEGFARAAPRSSRNPSERRAARRTGADHALRDALLDGTSAAFGSASVSRSTAHSSRESLGSASGDNARRAVRRRRSWPSTSNGAPPRHGLPLRTLTQCRPAGSAAYARGERKPDRHLPRGPQPRPPRSRRGRASLRRRGLACDCRKLRDPKSSKGCRNSTSEASERQAGHVDLLFRLPGGGVLGCLRP